MLANVSVLMASTVTGSMEGTVEAGYGSDVLNIFGCPAKDCSNQPITVTWSYDPSQFGPAQTGAGYSQAKGLNMGTISETINGVTKAVDSSGYFYYYAGTSPAQPNDLFQLGADSALDPISGGTEADYTLISFIPGGTWLNGLGPVQSLQGPVSSDSGGALEVTQTTGAGSVGETILFTADKVDLNATPEPSTWLLLVSGLTAAGAWGRRKRKAAKG